MTQLKQKQVKGKQSRKSSSLISSSWSSSSSLGSQSKYQKKQLQLSKQNKNDTQITKKNSKKNKSYSSRSRSHSSDSKGRSRSKKKQKKRHSKTSHRNRSRSKSHKKDKYRSERRTEQYRSQRNRGERDHRHRREQRDRDRKYDDRRDRRIRGRSRQKTKNDKKQQTKTMPTQIPMPIQVPMPPIPGQRRKRQRSRSPLDYYRRNQNNNEGDFWDSFSWVPRMNYTPNVSSSALLNTKKMRRLMITNIPFEMGISKDDLRDLITRFMSQNYLKDSMNNCPVRDLEINEEDHSVAVELSSVEQTCRMCKLEKIELFKGTINGIIRLGDSCYGNNIVTQAQNAAQAQAAAFAAINVLENKKTNFNMDVNLNKGLQVSTLIRVTNAVTPYMATHLTPEQWQEFHEDLVEGFSQYGKIVHNWFVKTEQKDICADPGNLFIQYESQQQGARAMGQMQGRIYDQRVIKLFYVQRQIYYPNYRKGTTPPTVKAPPKVQRDIQYANLPQISKSSHIATKAAQ